MRKRFSDEEVESYVLAIKDQKSCGRIAILSLSFFSPQSGFYWPSSLGMFGPRFIRQPAELTVLAGDGSSISDSGAEMIRLLKERQKPESIPMAIPVDYPRLRTILRDRGLAFNTIFGQRDVASSPAASTGEGRGPIDAHRYQGGREGALIPAGARELPPFSVVSSFLPVLPAESGWSYFLYIFSRSPQWN